MENQKQVVFNNFKLGVFRSIIDQNLIVDKQLIFEFSNEFIRSCIYSATKSFLKLITTETKNLCEEFNPFETFDLYVLRGDMFKKFLSVYSSEVIDIKINLTNQKNRWKASSIEITGTVETGNILHTTFLLSTEEMLTNKIDDFEAVIAGSKPSQTMSKVVLSGEKIQEIKRLIKKLHRANVDNTPYLTFNVDAEQRKIIVNDKVFTIEFDIAEEFEVTKNSSFNILKSDFVIAGNQTFSIFSDVSDPRVIFGGAHGNSIIWCLLSKVSEEIDDFQSSVVDSTIDSLDIDDLDDLFS